MFAPWSSLVGGKQAKDFPPNHPFFVLISANPHKERFCVIIGDIQRKKSPSIILMKL
jgi:hypothetical protein